VERVGDEHGVRRSVRKRNLLCRPGQELDFWKLTREHRAHVVVGLDRDDVPEHSGQRARQRA
jgi:hypothetical protein